MEKAIAPPAVTTPSTLNPSSAGASELAPAVNPVVLNTLAAGNAVAVKPSAMSATLVAISPDAGVKPLAPAVVTAGSLDNSAAVTAASLDTPAAVTAASAVNPLVAIVGENVTNLKQYTSSAMTNEAIDSSERDFAVDYSDDEKSPEVQMLPSDSSESDGHEVVEMLPYVHRSPPPANVPAKWARKVTSFFLDHNDLRNQFPVTVSFPLIDDIPLSKRSFTVKGAVTLERFLHQLWLNDYITNPMCQADFRTQTTNESIPLAAMMGQILKRNPDDSCGLFLVCYLGIHQVDDVFGED